MEASKAIRKLKPTAVRKRWRIVAAVMVAILTCLVLIQVIQVRHIQRIASNIKVGDTRAQVVKLLGEPRVTYSSGFSKKGGAATVWGSCYGGLLNSLRASIDMCVLNACGGETPSNRWYQYQELVAQKTNDWPVVIEFDKDGTVVKVKY
jgi:hypothetical protein